MSATRDLDSCSRASGSLRRVYAYARIEAPVNRPTSSGAALYRHLLLQIKLRRYARWSDPWYRDPEISRMFERRSRTYIAADEGHVSPPWHLSLATGARLRRFRDRIEGKQICQSTPHRRTFQSKLKAVSVTFLAFCNPSSAPDEQTRHRNEQLELR